MEQTVEKYYENIVPTVYLFYCLCQKWMCVGFDKMMSSNAKSIRIGIVNLVSDCKGQNSAIVWTKSLCSKNQLI